MSILSPHNDHIRKKQSESKTTSNITTVSYHLNFVVSTPDVKYATIDMKYFYHVTHMQVYEYMRIPLSSISLIIIKYYNLTTLAEK